MSPDDVRISPTDEDRARLGRAVRRGREVLRLSIDNAARAAPMSPVTWANVEKGLPVRGLTYAGIEHVLGWVPGSVAGLLSGDEETPTFAPPQPTRPGRLPADFSLRDEYERIRDLAALSWEGKFHLIGEVISLYEQDQAERRPGREARSA